MAKYLVSYWEQYIGEYVVEADSEEDACDTLMHDILEGKALGPDNCCDSGCNAEQIGV